MGLESTVVLLSDLAEVEEGRGAKDELHRIERRLAGAGFFGEALLIQLADRRTVGVLQRTTVGPRREGEQLVVGTLRLEAFRTEHGDLFGPADRLGHRALDDDLADADVRQLAFAEDVGAADAGGADRRRELLLVALVDRNDRRARFVGSVREDEARGLAGFEPDAELEAGRGVVGHHAAGEQRFDGLRIVDVALGDITGYDAQDERLR